MADELNNLELEELKDEDTKPDDELIDVEPKDTEPDLEDVPDSSGKEVEDHTSFVKKVMSGLKSFVGKGDKEEESEEGDDIPDDIIKVLSEQGWTDEEIIDFASDYTNEELTEMIPFLTAEDKVEELEETPPAKKEETPNRQDLKPDEKMIAQIKEEIRKEFQKELDDLKEKVKIVDETTEAQAEEELWNTVNGAFDEAGKEFNVFGQTKELPTFPAGPKKGQYVPTSPAMKARNEVFQKAVPYIQNGIPIKDAMEIALTWYKGANLEADVKRNLIKDLKGRETKLSAKRTAKETVPQFEDEEEYRADFIKRQAAKLGIKLEE